MSDMLRQNMELVRKLEAQLINRFAITSNCVPTRILKRKAIRIKDQNKAWLMSVR